MGELAQRCGRAAQFHGEVASSEAAAALQLCHGDMDDAAGMLEQKLVFDQLRDQYAEDMAEVAAQASSGQRPAGAQHTLSRLSAPLSGVPMRTLLT